MNELQPRWERLDSAMHEHGKHLSRHTHAAAAMKVLIPIVITPGHLPIVQANPMTNATSPTVG
ncbi:MAG: hypothetical protein ABI980_12370 [Nitrospirota bacterium]|jgi:hypothetical protein